MRLPNDYERDLDVAVRELRAASYLESTRPKDSKLVVVLATLLLMQTIVGWLMGAAS